MITASHVGKSLIATFALGVGLGMTGVGVAAGTGSLPPRYQQVAHEVAGDLGVPAPHHTGPVLQVTPAGPAPTDQAEMGPRDEPDAAPGEEADTGQPDEADATPGEEADTGQPDEADATRGEEPGSGHEEHGSGDDEG